jgi:hypothetical protein
VKDYDESADLLHFHDVGKRTDEFFVTRLVDDLFVVALYSVRHSEDVVRALAHDGRATSRVGMLRRLDLKDLPSHSANP